MRPIRDKIFLDTNILIYAYSSDEPTKKHTVEKIIEKKQEIVISTQVINEFVNVLIMKRKATFDELSITINELSSQFSIVQVTMQTIEHALKISQKYHYSYFDSLIIASALEYNCSLLYTEDMHHSQLIDSKLKISNPFNKLI